MLNPHPISVYAALTSNGASAVVVETGPNHIDGLLPTEAIAYGRYVFEAAARAVHDAAVTAQLTSLGVPRAAVVTVLRDLRKARPSLDAVTHPMTLTPVVLPADLSPRLRLSRGDTLLGYWTPTVGRSHATAVFTALATSGLETTYRYALTGAFGLSTAYAETLIACLDVMVGI